MFSSVGVQARTQARYATFVELCVSRTMLAQILGMQVIDCHGRASIARQLPSVGGLRAELGPTWANSRRHHPNFGRILAPKGEPTIGPNSVDAAPKLSSVGRKVDAAPTRSTSCNVGGTRSGFDRGARPTVWYNLAEIRPSFNFFRAMSRNGRCWC